MAQLCQDTSPLSTSALARAAATEAADTRARRQSVSAAFQTPAVCTPCDDSATRSEEIHHRTQDATDDGDNESDDRVSMLEKQVGDMTDLIKKMLLQNQQQAADARARENALTAQLAAASATKLSQSKSLHASVEHALQPLPRVQRAVLFSGVYIVRVVRKAWWHGLEDSAIHAVQDHRYSEPSNGFNRKR